jgi:hypothetical protein
MASTFAARAVAGQDHVGRGLIDIQGSQIMAAAMCRSL